MAILKKTRSFLEAVLFGSTIIRLPPVNFASGLDSGAWLLHGLVHAIRPSVCVEIGSARGLSACYIGLALKQLGQGKLYAIDPHMKTEWNDHDSVDTYETMRKNLKTFGVETYIEIIRDYSEKAALSWRLPIDMLFIDGDHSYKGVRRDWELFVPYVKKSGVVVFHDTLWELRPDPQWKRADMGVPQFVEELRKQGYPVITFDCFCGISIVQPVKGGRSLLSTRKK